MNDDALSLDLEDEIIETQDNEIVEESQDITEELLSLQGISDINKIKFEDESGAMIEKSWDQLSREEKIMILSHQEDPETSLDSSEIELINQIRESGLTPDQFIQNLQTKNESPQDYEVDYMTDDELFCLDLLDKVGSDNITDEELQEALNNAKSNLNIYNKQVASLRSYYKQLEGENRNQKALEEQQLHEENYLNFSNNVVESIKNFNSSSDIPVELSVEEMEDLAEYILERDESGYSKFARLLNDPMQFTKAAFWIYRGPEILNEMQKQIKEAYLRGYNENNNKKVFTKPLNTNKQNESSYAYFDEDSYI